MVDAHYLHMLDGRLRIRVPEVKRSPRAALHVEETISALEGVTHVKANSVTGNVLVLFESHLITHGAIVEGLKIAGYLVVSSASAPMPHTGTSIGDRLARSVVELLLERAVLALL